MKRVIGIYGNSSVGKTTVAKAVASRLRGEVRHCGELAKNRASELGIHVRNLPSLDHDRLDAETRKLAEECQTTLIIEGRFLDRVLRDLPNVLLVELECGEEERLRRARKRHKIRSVGAMRLANEIDSGETMHKSKAKGVKRVSMKTDSMRVSEVVAEVLKQAGRFFHDAA